MLLSKVPGYFKARSKARDSDNDYARAASIFRSIEHELEAARAEHAGLTSRINDALARAAVTLGDDSDEYLTRDRSWMTRSTLALFEHFQRPVGVHVHYQLAADHLEHGQVGIDDERYALQRHHRNPPPDPELACDRLIAVR
jgi:hypothetical protein